MSIKVDECVKCEHNKECMQINGLEFLFILTLSVFTAMFMIYMALAVTIGMWPFN